MQSGAVTIRRWQAGDFALLAASAADLSPQTLRLRFWASHPTLPVSYLRSTAQRWPLRWDAVVAVDTGRLVGWAEFGRYPDQPEAADVAVCVVDSEQGHGLGTALLTALLEQARGAGLVSVHADIAPFNEAARHAWRSVTGAGASTFALAG